MLAPALRILRSVVLTEFGQRPRTLRYLGQAPPLAFPRLVILLSATSVLPLILSSPPAARCPILYALVGLSGNPNWTYSILASTDLVNWTKIGSATTGTNGLCQFEDVDAASFPGRFYRACSP